MLIRRLRIRSVLSLDGQLRRCHVGRTDAWDSRGACCAFAPDHLDGAAVKALDKEIKLFTQDEWDAEHISAMGFANIAILQYSGTVF